MSITFGDLVTKTRQRCDLEEKSGAETQTNAEIKAHLNDAARVAHDMLIDCAGAVYSRLVASLTTVAGTSIYSLDAVPPLDSTDFYKLIRVGLETSTGEIPLKSFAREGIIKVNEGVSWGVFCDPQYELLVSSGSANTIEFHPAPTATHTVNIWFHPVAPEYSSDGDLVTLPSPAIDFMIVESAIRMKDKEERESSYLKEERATVIERIVNYGATFDQASSKTTLDVGRFRYNGHMWRRYHGV